MSFAGGRCQKCGALTLIDPSEVGKFWDDVNRICLPDC